MADNDLPQRQQEGLETIVGLIAVAEVTYMIIWMRRNARGLKAELEGNVAHALATGSTMALVGMAFLAVLREGFETAVFLLAVFQDAANPTTAGFGAVLGLVAAVVIGYGIYRGGVRINLSRFFRLTGLVLALVAAGLLATACTPHTRPAGSTLPEPGLRHELARAARARCADRCSPACSGSSRSPTVGEVAVWLLYADPVLAVRAWPDRWRIRRRRSARTVAVAGTLWSSR